MTVTDPRQSSAFLLEVVRDGRWRTRVELQAVTGPAWPLLLGALERAGHRFSYDRSKVEPGTWFRVRLVYEAPAPRPAAAVDEPQQLGLEVGGSAPPCSALIGLEDAA